MNESPEQLAHRLKLAAEELVAHAERNGVCLTITRESLRPLAMGHARHVVEARPARHQPAPPAPRRMSDREWAAQPANLREGCTVHVPGVGDL